ncbi:tetratricopeptide repeat protein [Adhaeribacter rhizoryzae]|uniref:Tetratricopeptide repeat protein n=1 Tax=Adhaeribacter rhizoryzae TaxID=2607907 RepID=A0A5M6DJQ8_9BACT|nr:tetratricopeptide repeat protein [Adhaeribacter rhizoryzae]KAA5547731.1 tetratricopeptide repeat protein [Adhaeribacter rhizoryzae]
MNKFHKIIITSALVGGTHWAEAQHQQAFTSKERYYQEGLELFDRQLYGAAQQAFAKYVSLQHDATQTADAQYYYAVSGLYLLHNNAENLILDFASAYPAHPKASLAYYELGLFYFNKKNYNKAVEYLEKVPTNKLDTKQAKEAEFKLAYSYFAQKDFKKAKPLFDRSKTGNHDYVYAANYYAGYIAYQDGDYAGAKKDLKEAEKNEAYKQIVPYMLTQISYREGDLKEVISYGEGVLKNKPLPQNADEIRALVGDAYFQQGDYKNANRYFNEYVKGKRDIENNLEYKIGFSYYKVGDFKNAINYLKNVALQKDALGQNAAYHLGLSYLKEKNPQFALTAFDQARRQEFDKQITEAAYIKYAQLNYETGNFSEVINAMADFNKKFPKSKFASEADDILSESYLNSNNYAEAIRHIESLSSRSERINQTYQRVTYYQGVKLFNDSRFQEAVQLLDKSLQHPYDNELKAASHFLKGEAYSLAQRYNDAINSYGAVFRTTNANKTEYYPKTRYGIGYAYYNTKQYDKAQTHFAAYINDNSAKSSPAYLNDAIIRLADCYYIAKNYAQALSLYDQAITQNAQDRDYAYFQKGVIYGLTGKREEAAQSLRTLLTQYPKSQYADEGVYQKAALDFEAGSYAAAISGFTDLIQNRSSSRLVPYALQKRGLAYNNLKKPNEAIADFKRVLDEYPSSKIASNALLSLQETMTANNQTEGLEPYIARFRAANPQSNALESIEFEAAKTLYFNEKYAQAITKLENYIKTYPNTTFAGDAKYFLADSYLKSNKKDVALVQFREVVAENQTEYMNRALQRTAELEFDGKNYAEAIKYYSKLSEVSANKREQANALMGMMRSYYLLNDFANTAKVADELIAQGNAALNAYNSGLLYKAKATYGQGNLDEALKQFTATATSATDANGAEAQYAIAEIYYKQNKYKESLDAAQKVGTTFANYDYLLVKSFLLIADNYVAQKEMFQAKATLNSIIENATIKELVDEAKAKLAAIDAPTTAPAVTPDSTSTNEVKKSK